MTMAGDGLGRLCRGGGWTYGALWCYDCSDPRLLVLEEGYHEEQSEKIFEVFNQVHVVGQGIIGEVAISGKHRWINFDTICVESNEISSSVNNPDIFQTIAIIPLPSWGVLQLGSTHKIRESSDSIAQAQHLLRQFRIKQHGCLHVDMNFSHPRAAFDSVNSSLDYSRFKNNVSSNDCIRKQRREDCLSSECSSLASGILSLGSQIGARSRTSSLKHHEFSLPVSTSSVPFSGHGNLFNDTSSSSGTSYRVMDQQAASTKARILLQPNFNFTSQNGNPENSALIHSNAESTDRQIQNKSMNYTTHSCERTDDQLNNGLLPDLPIASSGMAGNVNIGCDWNRSMLEARNQIDSDNDLFDEMEMDLVPMISRQECWDFRAGLSDCISELEMGSVMGSGEGLFSDSSGFEQQLLDAVVAGNADVSTKNSAICPDLRHRISTTIKHGDGQIPAVSPSKCGKEKMAQGSLSNARRNSHVRAWIDETCGVDVEGSALHQPKKSEESAKVVRKRARQGESIRPRPKDRQQIQDRVKELREIVPNGAKCSIDSLLDRTIKHMLYLQSVTKHVDKLKQADEPKLIGEDIGVVLKDNANGGVGGATWAYEVARQTMVCPIMVEDVHHSGQMLVEMLCEERGFFLEIADLVRGFGLTILKGDIEIHERKVWARFLVEANRDVTRMDIFLSLVQFLQQTSSFRADELHSRAISTDLNSFSACQQQSSAPIPIGLAGKFH